MIVARKDPGLSGLRVVYSGTKEYPLDDVTRVVPLESTPRLAKELRGD